MALRIIAGSARGRKLLTPRGRSTRPALERLRESLFSVLSAAVGGSRVLDLFAGVGTLGLEALSRGAREAHFVEGDPALVRLLERNAALLGFAEQAAVTRGDALGVPFAASLEREPFDIVFLDPPFAMLRDPGREARLWSRLEEILAAGGVAPGGTLVLRLPASWRGELPRSPRERRRYGRSVVAFFGSPRPP